MKKAFIILSVLFLFSCENNESKELLDNSQEEEIHLEKISESESEYTMKVTENAEYGWGYQLYKDGKLMIDQKHIPAVQGEQIFGSKEKAEITGNFILQKIKNGEFPPTVSVQELDSLGILD